MQHNEIPHSYTHSWSGGRGAVRFFTRSDGGHFLGLERPDEMARILVDRNASVTE